MKTDIEKHKTVKKTQNLIETFCMKTALNIPLAAPKVKFNRNILYENFLQHLSKVYYI